MFPLLLLVPHLSAYYFYTMKIGRTGARGFAVFSVMLFMVACRGEISHEDRKAAGQGMINQEVKKVSQADIFAAGLLRGRQIAEAAQQSLGKKLKETMANEGVHEAIRYCNIQAYPLVDSLSSSYRAHIKRVSLKLRNADNQPDSLENVLLNAYQYNVENNMALQDNIVSLDEKYLLYTKPIRIGDPVCLKCHGKAGSEVLDETFSLIKSLYPADSATGYKMTELRGMWSIRLPVKDIVNTMDD